MEGDHPWRQGWGESRAWAGGQCSNIIQVGPRRISCLRGNHIIIRSLGVPGGRCVGGFGCGGVGEDGVEVVEVTELVCDEVAGVVAAELCCHVDGGCEDGVFRANCRVS